jgi:hypothetical protein
MNNQGDLKRGVEIAGVDLPVALGQQDLTADVGMIPTQNLQAGQLRICGGSREKLTQALLVVL